MLNSILGRKVGMTQLFTNDGKVVPVTVIDVANWFVTQAKSVENDGYAAVQLGLLKKKYRNHSFDNSWLKKKSIYFAFLREVKVDNAVLQEFKIGQEIKLNNVDFNDKSIVRVTGRTKGKGFKGVVGRWHFSGGFATHGSMFHRRPGAIGSMRTQGEVIKGKKLPGHTGDRQITVKGLRVVCLDLQGGYLFVKGAVPGKKDSLITVSKQG